MQKIKRLLVTLISFEKAVTKTATGWFKMVKMTFTLTKGLFLVSNENMELCLYIVKIVMSHEI